MIIFDIPAASGRSRLRAAALGSCRVRQPLTALTERGDLIPVATGLHKSHTARHALYLLEIVAGEVTIPDIALPYLFDSGKTPRPRRLNEALNGGADLFILEVCSANQFFYWDTPLQEHLVAEKLVKPHGRALLSWYRDVCVRGAADEACVQDALVRLRDGGFALDNMQELLRGVRLRRQGVEEIARDLEAMKARLGGDCLLVGPFAIAEAVGAMMTERRALIASVRAVASLCDVAMYDPSPFISNYGREVVLRANGRDLYHYATPFLPVVGEALVREMLGAITGQHAATRTTAAVHADRS
jgi:hypothetical protein